MLHTVRCDPALICTRNAQPEGGGHAYGGNMVDAQQPTSTARQQHHHVNPPATPDARTLPIQVSMRGRLAASTTCTSSSPSGSCGKERRRGVRRQWTLAAKSKMTMETGARRQGGGGCAKQEGAT